MVDGKQCTVVWYVDDNKISHVDPKVVDKVIDDIEKQFGKMTVTRGKKHTFVGMDITFTPNNRVNIIMKDYITECFTVFAEDLTKGAATPATRHLFEINENSLKLNEEKSEIFHHIVSKLLYVAQRARIDIQLTIAFLCTRVSCSTEEDWGKLNRLLRYLYSTIDMPRILGANGFEMIQTWVDAAYAVHADMRSHTGGLMSLGTGVFNSKSIKQKLNTKSSTEAEVVGASDYLPFTIWTKRFLKAQGYNLDTNIYYQDNESAIKMETNGRKSCGEKSRHIDIRYFFIKDVIKREGIDIKHCPTDLMLADYFTKPQQGKLFKTMRDIIMGIAKYPIEECVGKGDPECTIDGLTIKEDKTSNKVKPKMTYAQVLRGTTENVLKIENR